jgi:hypothetical protein
MPFFEVPDRSEAAPVMPIRFCRINFDLLKMTLKRLHLAEKGGVTTFAAGNLLLK